MRRVRCEHVPEKDALCFKHMWCERPYVEAAEDHLRVTLIRSGRHRYRLRGLCIFSAAHYRAQSDRYISELGWNHD